MYCSVIWEPSQEWSQPPTKRSTDQEWRFLTAASPGVEASLAWTADTAARAGMHGSLALGGGSMKKAPSSWWPSSASGPRPAFWTMPRRDPSRPDPAGGIAYEHELASGWPLLALFWTRTIRCTPGTTTEEIRGGFTRPSWLIGLHKGMLVPFRPVWSGFIVNTLAAAIAWFVLIDAIPVIRDLRRFKRGSCLACGYDLRGDLANGCPECGWRRE